MGGSGVELEAIWASAREKLQGICRVCRICNGALCAGEVPGMGGLGTGAAFKNNVRALAAHRLNMRTIHGVTDPVLTTTILGRELAMPILGAAIGGTGINFKGIMAEEAFARAMVDGAKAAGTIAMTGDGPDPVVFDAGLAAVKAAGGQGIPIIKPREVSTVISYIRRAEEAGAVAVGIDIDAAGLVNMTLRGQPVGPKLLSELKAIRTNTNLPLILKGVMTPDEAVAAVRAGVNAIVVSNHGGRALDHTPGVADVLPDIACAVKGKLTILADGGVRSGTDVMKYLALGADAVLVGRPLAVAAIGGGAAGVAAYLRHLAGELSTAMLLTGCQGVRDITPQILFQR